MASRDGDARPACRACGLVDLLRACGPTPVFSEAPPDPDVLDRIVEGASLSASDGGALEMALVVDPMIARDLDRACLDRLEMRYTRRYAHPWVFALLGAISTAVNEDDRVRTRTVLKAGNVFRGAPVLALVIGDPSRPFAEASARQALWSMALMGAALGLGFAFVDAARTLLDRSRRARNVLSLRPPNRVLGVLCLGHAGDISSRDEGRRLDVRRIGATSAASRIRENETGRADRRGGEMGRALFRE